MSLVLILIVVAAGVIPPGIIAVLGHLRGRKLAERTLKAAEAIRAEAEAGADRIKAEMMDFTKKEILKNRIDVGGDLTDVRQDIFQEFERIDEAIRKDNDLARDAIKKTEGRLLLRLRELDKLASELKRTPEEEAAFFKRMQAAIMHSINGKIGSMTREITDEMKEDPAVQDAKGLIREASGQGGGLGAGFGNRIAAAVEKNITDFLTQ